LTNVPIQALVIFRRAKESSMSFRIRAVAALVAIIGMTSIAVPAGSAAADAYVFPSTNAINTANGLPHVTEVSKGIGTVTLQFVNPTNSLACFEYRIDGQTVDFGTHPVVTGDTIHDTVCVDGRPSPGVDSVTQTFTATSLAEVRLALGGERDWDFDWTPFTVGQAPPASPTTKDDCKRGGWVAFGFRNQGQCIKFVDSAGDEFHDHDDDKKADRDDHDKKHNRDRDRRDNDRNETVKSRDDDRAKRRS
jgi:hypothetical protein